MDAKSVLRASVLAARAVRPAEQREADERRIAEHGIALAGGAGTSAVAYASVGTEPPTRQLLDALVARGVRVVLPVTSADGLRWGLYAGWGALGRGRHGLLEPPIDPAADEAAHAAHVAFVPALAVDRAGNRLGRGGGYIDRWLEQVGAATRVVAVVYPGELVAAVPHEAHDRPVHAALTPDGVVMLAQ